MTIVRTPPKGFPKFPDLFTPPPNPFTPPPNPYPLPIGIFPPPPNDPPPPSWLLPPPGFLLPPPSGGPDTVWAGGTPPWIFDEGFNLTGGYTPPHGGIGSPQALTGPPPTVPMGTGFGGSLTDGLGRLSPAGKPTNAGGLGYGLSQYLPPSNQGSGGGVV